MVKTETTTAYITSDNKRFLTEKEARDHQAKLNNIKYFRVLYDPELNEGRGMQSRGYILVHANDSHEKFARHWCYLKLGNEYEFVMGTYGSNAIVENWILASVPESQVERARILTKIEENFVPHVWNGDPLQFTEKTWRETRSKQRI